MPSSSAMRGATGEAGQPPLDDLNGPAALLRAGAGVGADGAPAGFSTQASQSPFGGEAGTPTFYSPKVARSMASSAPPMTAIGWADRHGFRPASTNKEQAQDAALEREVGTSTFALSVSMSRIMSPWATARRVLDPFDQRAFAMSKPNLGIVS